MIRNRIRPRYRRLTRGAILIAGLVLCQAILIGPSLIGQKIFLPLDILQVPPFYLPESQWHPENFQGDIIRTDPIVQLEPNRVFAVKQVRSGHLPLWNPYNYCGAPFLAANQPAILSPFRLLDYLWPSPMALAWGQVLRALIAGGGAYLFFRRALRLRFTASVLSAWCYPIGGFLTQWGGYLQASEVTWLPFLLLAADSVVRSPRRSWPIVGLALVTAAVLLSGHSATGVQMLVFAGFFGLWVIHRRFGAKALFSVAGLKACGALAIGWMIGIGLSMPQTLPTLQYIRDSYRIASRTAGFIESPPDGWHALPQLVLPYFFGETAAQHAYLLKTNLLEGLSAGYAGLILAMVVAPFAWLSRRHRGDLIFWAIVWIVGVGYILNIPLLHSIYRAPAINTLRNNRLTFVSGFATLCCGAVGFNVLLRRRCPSAIWVLTGILAVIVGSICLYRANHYPESLNTILSDLKQNAVSGQGNPLIQPEKVTANFTADSLRGAIWCAAAIAALSLAVFVRQRGIVVAIIGIICIAELLVTASQIDDQGDAALYYPHLPVLSAIAERPPGRICGVMCLPAAENLISGLSDVRGYDAADPIEFTQLLETLISPQAPEFDYARIEWFFPERESPVLDLLDLRYLIGYGTPQQQVKASWSDGDYFIIERPSANTRVFVPYHVEVIRDGKKRLDRMTDGNWSPDNSLILESPTAPLAEPITGIAHIVRDEPNEVEIDASMVTPGYVLLADRWDSGWHATVNGKPTAVLRADHAFRAVLVPAGHCHIVYRYLPTIFTCGCYIALGSALILVLVPITSFRRASNSSRA